MSQPLETITLMFNPGDALPKVGAMIPVESSLGNTYELKIKSIRSLRWGKNGAVVVECKATRRRIGKTVQETAP